MRVLINHDLCKHSGTYSERCLAATIRSPLGHELSCMAAIEDDGQPELTIILIEDGKQYEAVLHNQAEQDQLALEAMAIGSAALTLKTI